MHRHARPRRRPTRPRPTTHADWGRPRWRAPGIRNRCAEPHRPAPSRSAQQTQPWTMSTQDRRRRAASHRGDSARTWSPSRQLRQDVTGRPDRGRRHDRDALLVEVEPEPWSGRDDHRSVLDHERLGQPGVEGVEHHRLELLDEEGRQGRRDLPRGRHPDDGHHAGMQSHRPVERVGQVGDRHGLGHAVAHQVGLCDVEGLTAVEPWEEREPGPQRLPAWRSAGRGRGPAGRGHRRRGSSGRARGTRRRLL